MGEDWLERAIHLGSMARQRRYAEGCQAGARWMLECRDMWDAHDDDGGIYFVLCQDFGEVTRALDDVSALPAEARLLGIYDLQAPLDDQGVGLTGTEFRRRGRPVAAWQGGGPDPQGALAALRPASGLALLCDPLGTAGGAWAEWAPEALAETLCMPLDSTPTDQVAEAIAATLRETSLQIWQRGQRQRLLDGVGAAIVVGYVRGSEGPDINFDFFVVWAGDCRAYAWDGAQLQRLTSDHRDPQIPIARPLVQYLGIGNLEPQAVVGQLPPSGQLILCSQSVAAAFRSTAEMAEIVAAEPDQAGQRLLEAAQARRPREHMKVASLQAGSA